MADPIRFTAVVQKVQTLADGGLRFTFDAPETEVMAAAELMEAKRVGVVVMVTIEPQVSDERQSSTVSRKKAKKRIA
jgi:Zn-dependent alcohol dehydrogenase